MATVCPLPLHSAGRPPFNRPPCTTFSPDPDDEGANYALVRAKRNLDELERLVLREDWEPRDLVPMLDDERVWLSLLIERERTICPTVLPPGIGIQHNLDEILRPENETVETLLRLLSRVEELLATQKKELKFRNMFADWG